MEAAFSFYSPHVEQTTSRVVNKKCCYSFTPCTAVQFVFSCLVSYCILFYCSFTCHFVYPAFINFSLSYIKLLEQDLLVLHTWSKMTLFQLKSGQSYSQTKTNQPAHDVIAHSPILLVFVVLNILSNKEPVDRFYTT